MNRHNLAQAAATSGRAAPRPATIRTADGLDLHYEDWGSGPPVVLVHSWALHSQMWRQQIPALTDAGLRVVAFDRRGHGGSGNNGLGFDMDTLADDLAAVMDQLDLSRAVLVGHSMAGGEIVRYLSRHGSDRVAKVVLLAPTTPYLIKTADNPLGLDAAMFEQSRSAWKQDFTRWVADNQAAFFTPETPAVTAQWMVSMLLECSLPVALATSNAFTEIDFRPEVAAISVPTLVVHGTADASAPLEITGRPTAALIPGGKLTVLPGAPHGLFLTHDREVNQAIVEFARA
jgi:pimeloyl-ACP methyl ester carboxylesterase